MEISLMMAIAIAIIAIYYGMGKNIEVSSRMLTRELEDAERLQKERIVKKYNNKDKDVLSDEAFAKATAHITRIDELDI